VYKNLSYHGLDEHQPGNPQQICKQTYMIDKNNKTILSNNCLDVPANSLVIEIHRTSWILTHMAAKNIRQPSNKKKTETKKFK
jgi:hypothetical protein